MSDLKPEGGEDISGPNALGVDVSHYNGPVQWANAHKHGIGYTGIRSTISWGYRDPFLAYNIAETRRHNVHRMYYHVLYPGESIARQTDNYLLAVGDNWDDAWPVLDAELVHGYGASTITNAMLSWCERIETVLKRRPIIYSRASWINSNTVRGPWRDRFDWWLAQYLYDRTIERPAPPAKPTGVTEWTIHQNADKFPCWPDFQGGRGFNTVIDINRWDGNALAVEKYFHRAGTHEDGD